MKAKTRECSVASVLHDKLVDASKRGATLGECVGALARVQANWSALYHVAFLQKNFPEGGLKRKPSRKGK